MTYASEQTVYAIGEVDYDIRVSLPDGIFSTLDAAKAFAGEDVTWEDDDGSGYWLGVGEGHAMRRKEWAISTYVVDLSRGKQATTQEGAAMTSSKAHADRALTAATFDVAMSDEERAEVAAMPSNELYLLTKMVPYGTVRAREVNTLYLECIQREILGVQPKKGAPRKGAK